MEDNKKIYMGNLDYGVTEEDIRNTLGEGGIEAKEINIISDRYTGRPRGFGFAEFETEEQTQKAIELLNGKEINGRALKVSKAQKKARKEGFGGGGFRGNNNRR